MKKTAMFLAALTLVGGTAFGAINVEVRGDYNNPQKYNNASNAEVSAASYFSFQRAKLKFTGAVNDSVSYKLRFDFSRPTIPAYEYGSSGLATASSMRTYPALDYAEMTHKMADIFALTVGKQSDMGMSAWEGQTSGGDMYFTSSAYYYPNLVGLKLDFTFDTHNVALYAYDNNDGAYDSTGAKKGSDFVNAGITRMGMGFAYKGWLMDKTLGLMASYHILPMNTGSSYPITERDDVYTSLGVQYKLDALLAEFDYLSKVSQKSVTLSGASAASDETTNSMVLTVKYAFGEFTPVFKYEMGTNAGNKNGYGLSSLPTGATAATSSVTDNITQFSLALEYKPYPENFRYHLAYNSKAIKYASDRNIPNATVTTNTIVAGLKLNHDLMK